MRFAGTHNAAQVSGLAGLAGTNAGAVYGVYAGNVKRVFETPFPTPTGARPPDALIFADKFAYLRQVLNNGDWDGVARWYATMIQQAVNASGYYDPLTYNAPVESRPVSAEPVPQVYIDTVVQTVPKAPPVYVPPSSVPVATGGRGRSVRLNGLADLSGLNPREYWNLSKLNLQDYCDRTFTLQDLSAHTQKCILKMCIADYGNKVGFGYAGRMDNLNLALFFANGLSHNDGQLDWLKSYEAAKSGSRYGFCLGWVKEPNKHTASNIIVAIGAAFMGAAAWQAISAGAGAASGGATGAAGGTGAGVGAGVGAGAATGAAAAAGVETVVVTATALAPVTAGTVAAGLAAGTIAASAAAPAIAAPSTTIETVVVEAAPVGAVSAGSVAAGTAAGAITTVAAAPPIVAPSTPSPQVIETVTTEASALPETSITAGTVGAGVAAGTIAATATAPAITSQPVIETVTVEAPADTIQLDPIEAAAIGTGVIAITQPVIDVPEPNMPDIEEGEPSLTDRIVEGLEDAIADYGAGWVQDQLEQLLEDLLGRPPTQTELEDWGDWINGGGATPPPQMAGSTPTWIYWLLGAAIAYALYEYSREPKKRRKASH